MFETTTIVIQIREMRISSIQRRISRIRDKN